MRQSGIYKSGSLLLTPTTKSLLAHFILLVSFYTPWKQKNIGFRMFSEGIERDQWYEVLK